MKYKYFLMVITIFLFSCTKNNDKKLENFDPYYIKNIEEKYIGIYLPLEYINAIELTKNHSFSLNLNKERDYHDVLIVTEHYIYSDYKFADQYAIKSNEVREYNFFVNNDSEIIICDNNGKLYKKISEYIDDYYDRISYYIGKIILRSLNVKQIGLFIGGTDVHIPFLNNQIYEIILYEKGIYLWSNLVLKNKNNDEWIYLVIENDKYTFYKAEIKGLQKIKSDEIIYELEIK
jgi:hypothetical protein